MITLKLLSLESAHGCGLGFLHQRYSGEGIKAGYASFVASLERMRRRGWLVAEWRQTASHRRALYYSLSEHGRAALLDSIEEWRAMSAAIESLIRKAAPEKTKPTRPAAEPL